MSFFDALFFIILVIVFFLLIALRQPLPHLGEVLFGAVLVLMGLDSQLSII